MSDRVFVSGMGIVSAIGNNRRENLDTLLNGQSGIGQAVYLNSGLVEGYLFGEVGMSTRQLSDRVKSRLNHHNSRTALLGLLAADEAAHSAGLQEAELIDCGLVSGTSVGGMDVSEQHYKTLTDGGEVDYRAAFGAHDCGFSTQYIADSLGVKGFISTISTACSSSANSIALASRLIKSGKLKICIAGGADALSLFTFHGFKSLMILDQERCRPFDETRKGLNLGEGAAFLVLESEESIAARGAKPLAELVGYGNANDAYHQTASSPEGTGATLAMESALKTAKIANQDISYINAHGTGTANNDLSECIAIGNIFGNAPPPYSSTKSYTGHTLGAAGAIEAVFSIFALQQQTVFANQQLITPMNVLHREPATRTERNTDIKYVLSNSFGFGGNCSSLIFKSVQ
ncbi:MAG: beta-ketoacyl-[acyl-carrier-protein] synthase family protein [Cyclobacteriaceae bacterium]|nr:beta-ketoacyl-[acyl-carrier-protein] synthase family protein [Cyclobacteriaceae bacterium]